MAKKHSESEKQSIIDSYIKWVNLFYHRTHNLAGSVLFTVAFATVHFFYSHSYNLMTSFVARHNTTKVGRSPIIKTNNSHISLETCVSVLVNEVADFFCI